MSDREFPKHVLFMEDGLLGTVLSTDPEKGLFKVRWRDKTTTTERLDADRENWIACLSKEQANACLEIVKEYILRKYGPGHDEPKLYAPGHEGPFWCIWLEGVAEEWAIRIGGYDETPFPEGVFTEPVNDVCLGLYPASN